ncbi:glutamate--cysteine ligase [Streptomyces sp. NPDC051211]|uniref:carboxylate-amine ligase n=1 Tax=Streptomyces sp. NPDC051211 TaxID=3154643 RepID=UPI00344E1DF7
MSSLTMGVEEEFLLVDRRSRLPVDRGPAVVEAAAEELGALVQTEFYTSQVEVCTTPTDDCGELREELARLRRTVSSAAADAGCRPVASGTAVLPPERPLTVTPSARYRRMARRYSALVGGYDALACGCHVHVGTLDRAQALGLANRMRPWLPALQSLAGNSPFARGRDTGQASRRPAVFARWPTAGPAPVVTEAGYEAVVASLVDRGILLDRRMVYWYARPSEHVPTLEIRVADTNADVDTVVLLAALVRGLAASLLPEVVEELPLPRLPERQLRQAHARAAAYGLAGPGLDPVTGAEVTGERLLDMLLARAAPGLESAGDLALVEEQLDRLRAEGDGAARQRAVHERRRGNLRAVVDALAAATALEP